MSLWLGVRSGRSCPPFDMRALHAGVAKFSFKIARHKLVLRKLWLS